MCKCRPNVRTPFCDRPGCEWPAQANYAPPSHETIRERLVHAHKHWMNKPVFPPLLDAIEAIITEAVQVELQRLSDAADSHEGIYGVTNRQITERMAELRRRQSHE